MKKKSNKKVEIVSLISSITTLLVVFKVNERLLPEPLSFIIPAAIILPCLIYLIWKIGNKK